MSATDVLSPTFEVPENVDDNTVYEYLLTATAAGATIAAETVAVTVLNRVLAVSCTDTSPQAYEGSESITLDCSASGAAPGAAIAYAWTSPSAPADTSRLSATDVLSPTFEVPENVDDNTVYEYLLTATAASATAATETVTVTVLNRIDLRVLCVDYSFDVYEGDPDFQFNCLIWNAPSGAGYTWTPRGNTPDVSLLGRSDVRRPFFRVPDDVPRDTTFEYAVTGSAPGAIYNDGKADVSVTVLDKEALSLTCTSSYAAYEGSEDITLNCSASGAAPGSSYAYSWEARGDTPDMSLLSATDIASPTFYVPDEVPSDTTFSYALTVSATGAHDAAAEVAVTVLDRVSLGVVCTYADEEVYEGAEDFEFDCMASGAPSGASYAYSWEASGDTPDTALLSATDVRSPLFHVPEAVSDDEIYSYTATASAEGSKDATAEVTVWVLNKQPLIVVCSDPGSVYEGSEDITLNCSASGAPSGSADEYVWEASGDTPDTALLSATDIASPTFYVPDEVDAAETYEYLLTVSAENAEDGMAEVTVTVLNKEALSLTCTSSYAVHEGSEDITLSCAASNAPEGSEYAYSWAAERRYAGHGAAEPGGHRFSDLLRAGRDGRGQDVRIPAHGKRREYDRR